MTGMTYSPELIAAQPWLACRVNGARCPGYVCCHRRCERMRLDHDIGVRAQRFYADWYDESNATMQVLTHQRIMGERGELK